MKQKNSSNHKNRKEESAPKDGWKGRFQGTWKQIKKVTATGLETSEKISKYATHQAKKGFLHHDRQNLFKDLGSRAFHLLEEGKIQHADLERDFERIKEVNEALRKETEFLANLQVRVEEEAEETDEEA